MEQRQIPPNRKVIFYLGITVGVIGFLCFMSTFVSAASSFGDFSNFEARGRSMFGRAMTGMFLMLAGGIMTGVGRLGLSGSGLKLDPEEARRDIEPWARMSGGVLKDTLDEAGIRFGGKAEGEPLSFDERLRRLEKLREEGLVNEDEYQKTKRRILENA